MNSYTINQTHICKFIALCALLIGALLCANPANAYGARENVNPIVNNSTVAPVQVAYYRYRGYYHRNYYRGGYYHRNYYRNYHYRYHYRRW